jgi:hypothetical protein
VYESASIDPKELAIAERFATLMFQAEPELLAMAKEHVSYGNQFATLGVRIGCSTNHSEWYDFRSKEALIIGVRATVEGVCWQSLQFDNTHKVRVMELRAYGH